MDDAYAYCEKLVRERDRERFLSTLFAPQEKRPHLFAISAFDLEIAHVPDAVREPMAGEIRLQWWRDVLAGERHEEANTNPVAAAVLETIAKNKVPVAALSELIDARSFDLMAQPMGSREALDAYLMASVGRPLELQAGILDSSWRSPEEITAASRALGLTRVLRNIPHDVGRGRIFLPLDLLAKHGIHTASVLGGETSEGLGEAIGELRESARIELAGFRTMRVPSSVLPAFLPLTLTPLYLARTQKSRYDPFRSNVSVSALRSQFALWRAARAGKV